MDVKVIEPIKNYLKEFNSPDEFNLFYSKNKSEIDAFTTHKLNKMYHIIGYRITKIKGVLMLKKWDESKNIKTTPPPPPPPNITEELDEIHSEIDKIKEAVNGIIAYIDSLSQPHMNVSPPSVI